MPAFLVSATSIPEDFVRLVSLVAAIGLFLVFTRTQPLRPYFHLAAGITPVFSGWTLMVLALLLARTPFQPAFLPMPLPGIGSDWGETLATSRIGHELAGAASSGILSPLFLPPASWITAILAFAAAWTWMRREEPGEEPPPSTTAPAFLAGHWPVGLLVFHGLMVMFAGFGWAPSFTGHPLSAFVSLWGKTVTALIVFLYAAQIWHEKAARLTPEPSGSPDDGDFFLPLPREPSIPLPSLVLPSLALTLVQTLLLVPEGPLSLPSLPLVHLLPALTLMLLTAPLAVIIHNQPGPLGLLLRHHATLLTRGLPALFWFFLAASVHWLVLFVLAGAAEDALLPPVPAQILAWAFTLLSSLLWLRLTVVWFLLLLPLTAPPSHPQPRIP